MPKVGRRSCASATAKRLALMILLSATILNYPTLSINRLKPNVNVERHGLWYEKKGSTRKLLSAEIGRNRERQHDDDDDEERHKKLPPELTAINPGYVSLPKDPTEISVSMVLSVQFNFLLQTPADGPHLDELLNAPGSTFEQNLIEALEKLLERVVKDEFGDTTKAESDSSAAGLRGLRTQREDHQPCFKKFKRAGQILRSEKEKFGKTIKRMLLVQYHSSNSPILEFGGQLACPSGTKGQCRLVSVTAIFLITNDEDPGSVRERLISAILKAIRNGWLTDEMENIVPNVKVRFTDPTMEIYGSDDSADASSIIAKPRTVGKEDGGLTVDEAVGIAVGCMVAIAFCNFIIFLLWNKFFKKPGKEDTKEVNRGIRGTNEALKQGLDDAASEDNPLTPPQSIYRGTIEANKEIDFDVAILSGASGGVEV